MGGALGFEPRVALAGLAAAVGCSACADSPYETRAPELRERMVREQIEARGVRDPRVLEAMREVPRHRFVPAAVAAQAYGDHPLSIGHRQTISQPYIVASMTELARLEPGDTVLEIGTGSGYQAAVLARLVRQVYSVELLPELADAARQRLLQLGIDNIEVITGDGYRGLPERAPFDAIVVTAAPEAVPSALVEQLAIGARLVIPVGRSEQELRVIERTAGGATETVEYPVRFVPLVPSTR